MWVFLMGALVILSFTSWLYRIKLGLGDKYNGKLPSGSMGFPLLGETLQFFAPHASFDLSPFIKKRMDRYGPVFKTSLVGKSMIVSTDSDLNHFIFQQEGKLFKSAYPRSFTKIFGKQSISSLHGFMHKYLKNMILHLFGLENLKNMIPDVEAVATTRLRLWSSHSSVEIKDEIESMIFDLVAKKLISYNSENSSGNLRENFLAFFQGLLSFPLDIPGTAYHKCLQGKKQAMRMLRNILQERKANPRKEQIDYFDYVVEELEKDETPLNEETALDLMFLLLFASFKTTSVALTVAIKFLIDHPHVLKDLTAEHEAILKQRGNVDSGFTWREYKSMEYTFQFINETMRLANIVPVIFREAMREVEFKGYTIPAGWGVMVCPPAVHLNPEKYVDPLAFNPWRWEKTELNRASKNFMAFGGGMRFCIGSDFAKVQMAVFLHCLVTEYRFKAIKGGNIVRTPGLQFPGGFYIQIMKKE